MDVDSLERGAQIKQIKKLAELLTWLDRSFRDNFKRSNGVPHNLTLAQYQVISLISDRGSCSQKDIARMLGVTGPTVVRIVDALEKKGLVTRARDNKDRRLVLISLTDKGRQAQHDCEAMHERNLASMIEHLPASTANDLLRSLEELLKAAPQVTGRQATATMGA